MQPLSEQTKQLLEDLKKIGSRKEPEQYSANTISVSNLTSGIEFLYEKIRNALEYREEHLWLKDAVLRILKRRFFEILAKEKIGREVVEELIRGRYLENSYYPESKAFEINEILDKYCRAFELFETSQNLAEKQLNKLEEWFLGFAALEIVDLFPKSQTDRLFINYFWQTAKQATLASPETLGQEFDQQLYLGIFRNFFKADTQMEQYEIFRLKYSDWFENPPNQAIAEISQQLPKIKQELETALKYPLRQELDRIMKRRSLFVFMLQDLINQEKENASAVLNDPELLEGKLRTIYETHYQKSRQKLQTSAIRAVVFIILTKMLFLFALEVPYQILTETVNYLVLGINTIIPPLLLIISSLIIKMPGEEQNFIRIVSEFERMIRYHQEMPALDIVKNKRQRSWPMRIALGSIYVLNISFTAWLLNLLFKAFDFNLADAFIFVLFLSLISFFAIRLRKTANQLAAVEEKEHLITAVVEFFFFPIIEVGKWISRGVASINLTAFIFDFLIETPFKTVIQILEEWFGFIREKKQNL
ncbi:MAG: hypothetical protein AB1721_01920 [Patescibacteria group bacterium]